MDVRTSARFSSIDANACAAFAFGRSTSRRTATLLTPLNATSIVDMTSTARIKKEPIRNSVPVNIQTCAADDARLPSFARRLFRGRIPLNEAVHAK